MRFLVLLVVCLSAVGCKPRMNVEAYNKLTADERPVVGKWLTEITPLPEFQGNADFKQMMNILSEIEKPVLLYMREDKTFDMDLYEQRISGTWEVKRPDVFLKITKVGGRDPQDVYKDRGRFQGTSGFEMPQQGRDEWLQDRRRFRALEVAEKYNRLTYPDDGKSMAAQYNSGTLKELLGGSVKFVLQP